jgi:acyl-homoserine lactone synthase
VGPMIHVVTIANQHLYARQLDQMFRMRHDYYVLGHGWEGVAGEDGWETDAFDGDSTVYLIAADPFGDVAASLRLTPCSGPTLLQKLRGDYCPDAKEPDDPAAWDLSRWIARPEDRRGTEARWKTNFQRELMIGLLEFCERRGVSRLTMLAELRLAERIRAYGWPVRYLGQPKSYEGGKGIAVAAEIETGLHVMALSRQKTGLHRTVSVEIEAPNIGAAPPPELSSEVLEAAADIGAEALARLARALGRAAAGNGDGDIRAIEFVGTLNRVLETVGSGLEDPGLNGSVAQSLPFRRLDQRSAQPSGS